MAARQSPSGRLAELGGWRLWIAASLTLAAGCAPEDLPPPPPERAAAQAAPAEPPAMERVAAAVGVGKKGRGYGEGMVTTPVATLFTVKEKLAFEIMIPHALDLYKATEGHAPASQEEFLEKIVKFNQIQLPALPPGHRYVYDPKSERLMVERPKQ
jgi:hypothetical protein